MTTKEIKTLLNKKVEQYNHIDFIYNDPISIPHQFSLKQDIEIAGFFAALISWGNRKSIISGCERILEFMDNDPYHFIMNSEEDELDWIYGEENIPIHRTFNGIDFARCVKFLKFHYWFHGEESLETAFTKHLKPEDENVENALNGFYHYFFNKEFFNYENDRTQKHIAAPFKKSACKRLNMFLRWMVRKDKNEVDFGLWQNIKTSQLIIPLDVHVKNVSEKLGLIHSSKNNWQTAVELTNILKQFDANDPVKYDYALFSLGVDEKY